jgi:hypothetical protein
MNKGYSKYKSIKEFRKMDPKFYEIARNRGMLNELSEHYDWIEDVEEVKYEITHNIKEIIELAGLCKTLDIFKKKYKIAYKDAEYLEVLDQVKSNLGKLIFIKESNRFWYRVILRVNGEYKETLYRCHTRKFAFINFHKFKEENKKVIFNKTHINISNKIVPVKYELCITKLTQEGDTFRVISDEYGKTYVEAPLGNWTILESVEWMEEESFLVFGEFKDKRADIMEIVDRVLINSHDRKNTKQICVVQNKLLIHNENQFDLVVCKCKEDAQRLHHAIAKIVEKHKLKSLLFMGVYKDRKNVFSTYRLIMEKFNWNYKKIRRTKTCNG